MPDFSRMAASYQQRAVVQQSAGDALIVAAALDRLCGTDGMVELTFPSVFVLAHKEKQAGGTI